MDDAIDHDRLNHWQNEMDDRDTLPPIIAVPEGGAYRALDGTHRASICKRKGIPVLAYIPLE